MKLLNGTRLSIKVKIPEPLDLHKDSGFYLLMLQKGFELMTPTLSILLGKIILVQLGKTSPKKFDISTFCKMSKINSVK